MMDADRRDARQRGLRGWAVAATLHLAIAAAVVVGPWASAPRAVTLPAPMLALELAPLPAAPAAPPNDAPAAPERRQAKPEPKLQPPQHKPPPLAPAPHAEVQAATPDARITKTEPPQVASVEAAPPPGASEHTEHVAAAPALGIAAQPALDAAASWESQVLACLDHAKRYPPEARWAHQQDTVYIDIVLDRRGRVLSARIGRSQGFASLDDEVIDMVRRAAPFSPPPPEIPGDKVALRAPVEFYLGAR